MIKTELLDKFKYPSDLRKIEKKHLKQVAKELREELIDAVSTTGGHLGAGLGVVELNRTEVKAPFRGYVEKIVKPGNLLNRGEICAIIIELDPLIITISLSSISSINLSYTL